MSESSEDWELGLGLKQILQDQLSEESKLERVLDICKGRRIPVHLRAQVWQLFLGVDEYTAKLPIGSDIYDLEDQICIRADCQSFVDKFGNEEGDRVSIVSDLESILTGYCKSTGVKYEPQCGWLEIIKPLMTLKVSSGVLYQCFRSILRDYIPRDVSNPEGLPFQIFRLLLLYHDPALCSLLDSKKITPYLYASNWFRTLFAGSSSLEGSISIWDTYLQYRDPFLVFHMALALLINAKDQALELKGEDKSKTIELLESLATGLEPDDVLDFITISNHYSVSTPNSYRKMFETALFGTESFLTFGSGLGSGSTSPSRRVAMHSLCMPISAEELLHSIRVAKSISLHMNMDSGEAAVRFFVVDCRPAEQYNAGHLPTAFHLDCGLMLQEPLSFNTAVQGLLLAQREAISLGSTGGGEHLCFVGSGREEEDQYVHMVVSSFLQRNTLKVGILSGGFQALHEILSPDPEHLSDGLSDHDPLTCLECKSNSSPTARDSPSNSTPEKLSSKIANLTFNSKGLFQSMSQSFKSKSVEIKGKVFDYIVNPTGEREEKHISSEDKNKSKPYRGAQSPFSMMDDKEADDNDLEEQQRVSIKAWLKKSEVLGYFPCNEVMANGDNYVGFVLVTSTNIYMLRETDERDVGEITVNRLLSNVIKITSKKKHPELITFKYGTAEGDSVIITHFDRFYLPKHSKDFVALVKKQIDSRMAEEAQQQ